MATVAPVIQAPLQIFPKSVSTVFSNRVLGNRWAYHIVFWSFVFLFNAAYIAFIGEDRNVSLYNLGLRIPFVLACCYVNLYWLMPRFYYSGKLYGYIVAVLFTIFALNAISLYLLQVLVESPICPTSFEADATFNSGNYVYKSFYLFSIVGLTSGIKLSKNHLVEKQRMDAIEKEKLQTELSLLKSQINPHFFFNTLNNLYALTLKKSEQAPEMVLKLSELMSYSLYDSDDVTVSLKREIAHIRNYIELESMRLANKMVVDFGVTGLREDRQVPPLIFLPVVENFFKHMATNAPDKVIRIALAVHLSNVTLQTSNPARTNYQSFVKKGGLGLRHLRRRLQLLYGSDFKLESNLNNGIFTTLLQIPVV